MTRTEYIIDDDFLDDETKMSAESQGYLWELIRCKECKYCTEKKSKAIKKHCTWWYRTVDDDDYCSRAERKE